MVTPAAAPDAVNELDTWTRCRGWSSVLRSLPRSTSTDRIVATGVQIDRGDADQDGIKLSAGQRDGIVAARAAKEADRVGDGRFASAEMSPSASTVRTLLPPPRSIVPAAAAAADIDTTSSTAVTRPTRHGIARVVAVCHVDRGCHTVRVAVESATELECHRGQRLLVFRNVPARAAVQHVGAPLPMMISWLPEIPL